MFGKVFNSAMEAFHLTIAMGGVWRGANVLYLVGGTKCIEGPTEFCAIISADFARVPK